MNSPAETAQKQQPVGETATGRLVAENVAEKLLPSELEMLCRLVKNPPVYIEHPALGCKDGDKRFFGVEASLLDSTCTRFSDCAPIVAEKTAMTGRISSLSAEQERLLFLRLNYARKQIAEAVDGDNPISLRTARLVLAWDYWESQTRARIVEQNLPLVLAMAKRTRLSGVDFNEMVSEGNMALLRSVDKFDCGKGFKFSTYACRAILKSFSRVAIRASRYRGTFPVEFDPAIEKSDHLERKRQELKDDCVGDLRDILMQNVAHLTVVEENSDQAKVRSGDTVVRRSRT